MSKHTPGPWNREAIGCLIRFSLSNHGPWDDLYDDSLRMPDYFDDHLIAAAPELLEALENLLKVHEGEGGTQHNAADMARAAIAKAKGEE